ncbi:hypothetical protein BB482_01670 [Helicobacter pylori]|nr:hypothetical protein BB482_01670 [Helicobacter pylori]
MERFCNHFPQKLKGFFKKVGLSLSFGCMRLNYRLLGTKMLALLTSFEAFLKTIINALLGQN